MIKEILIISPNSWCIKCNKPCLTKKSSFYVCNALSNASLDGNISYLVGPSHPKPAMHKNQLKGTKEIRKGKGNAQSSKMCPTSSILAWKGMASKHKTKINHKKNKKLN